jgi:hypothetical protein
MPTMEAAEEVNGVREIPSSVHAARFEQRREMQVATATLFLDSRKLGFRNVEDRTAKRPTKHHSHLTTFVCRRPICSLCNG